MPMSQRDRQGLRGLIRRRAKALEEEFNLREQALIHAAREEVFGGRDELKEKWVEIGSSWYARANRLRGEADALYQQARDEGVRLELPSIFPYNPAPPKVSVTTREKQWERVVSRIRQARRQAEAEAREKMFALEEELLVSGLESEDAHAFLDRIPTIESVLPKELSHQVLIYIEKPQ